MADLRFEFYIKLDKSLSRNSDLSRLFQADTKSNLSVVQRTSSVVKVDIVSARSASSVERKAFLTKRKTPFGFNFLFATLIIIN